MKGGMSGWKSQVNGGKAGRCRDEIRKNGNMLEKATEIGS